MINKTNFCPFLENKVMINTKKTTIHIGNAMYIKIAQSI